MPDVTVIQFPKYVTLTCEECNKDITFTYSEFLNLYVQPCDWRGEKIICNHCGYENMIEGADWD